MFHDFEVGVGDICFIARGKDLTEVSHTWVASPPPPPFQGTLFSICFPPWESNWSVFIYSFFLFFFSYLNGQGMWGRRVGTEPLDDMCHPLFCFSGFISTLLFTRSYRTLCVNITFLHSVCFFYGLVPQNKKQMSSPTGKITRLKQITTNRVVFYGPIDEKRIDSFGEFGWVCACDAFSFLLYIYLFYFL